MHGTSPLEAVPTRGRMARDVSAALLARPRSLPCMYFYDDVGSELFEQITRQPEYYQTRTEEALLAARAGELVAELAPGELVELGSGAGRKVRLLLDAMAARGELQRCLLFDVNALYLRSSVARLTAEYPGVGIEGVTGDFQRDLARLLRVPGGPRRLVLFLAGTIGNLPPGEVPGFLTRVRALLAPGDALLVGVDTVKDPDVLRRAYNDRAGITAAFNRNILRVMNRELRADFRPERWEHVAFWDEENAWIEMRLRSAVAQRVTIHGLGLVLDFRAGEELRTELSAKYTRDSFAARAVGSGLSLTRWDTDKAGRFALALLKPEPVPA